MARMRAIVLAIFLLFFMRIKTVSQSLDTLSAFVYTEGEYKFLFLFYRLYVLLTLDVVNRARRVCLGRYIYSAFVYTEVNRARRVCLEPVSSTLPRFR